MSNIADSDRRRFLREAGKAGAGLSFGLAMSSAGAAQNKKGTKGKEETAEENAGPTEDLMREHGVWNRVPLMYD